MAEIVCPTCNATNRGTAQYCAECGSPLLKGLKAEPEGSKIKTRPRTEEEEHRQAVSDRWVLQNRYDVKEILGQGGFGSVYKAVDANLNRTCAIKENLVTSAESQRQFMREATVLANLSHPNLPRVTDHFIVPDQGQYLVMDFVEGEDLEKILEKREIVPAGEALEWIIQVAGALDYLHNQEPPVFHRDIKPANIRITPKGKAMLVDFGLVKVFDEHVKTTMGARAITPGFAPPEQYGRGGTDARTDIYALGATLYALVTGHEPLESVRRMAGEHMPAAHALNPSVPLQLSDAIERAMALDPAKRYQNVFEFQTGLQAARDALGKTGEADRLVTVVVGPELDDPAVVRTAAYQAGQAMSSPVQPTQMMSSDFPVTTAVQEPYPSQPIPAAEPAAKPAGGRPNWLLIGIGGIALVVLCLALAGGGVYALFGGNGGDPVEQTLTARARLAGPVEMTLTARAEEGTSITESPSEPTSGANSTATRAAALNATATKSEATKAALKVQQTNAAKTSVAKKTATAKSGANATEQAVEQELAPYTGNAAIKYGPKSGVLVHEAEDELIERQTSSVSLRNFKSGVVFKVPYSSDVGKWDFGMLFRDGGSNMEYRLIIYANKNYEITSTSGDPDGEIIASGVLKNLQTGAGDENSLLVYAVEDQGWLFVNDQFITEFDTSQHYSGEIMIGIGLSNGAEITGKTTEYRDFTVWTLAAGN